MKTTRLLFALLILCWATQTSQSAEGTWNLTSAPSGTWQCLATSTNGLQIIAGINGGPVWQSTNGGASWGTNGPSKSWVGIASSWDGVKLAAAPVSGDSVYVSTNGGSTWSVTSSGARSYSALASSPDGNSLLAASFGDTLLGSTNGGASWFTSAASAYWEALAWSPDGSRQLAAVYSGTIYYSTNSGVSWTASDAPALNWASVCSAGSKGAAAAYDGGIYVTTNGGAHWAASSAATASWYGIASSADGSQLTAVVFGGGIYNSVNSGTTWGASATAPTENWGAVVSSADGSRRAAAVYGGGIYVSTNGSPTIPVISLTGSPNPSLPGSNVVFSVVVSNTAGTPTGTIILADGATALGTNSLVSGSVSFTNSLAAGVHSMSASYSGDTNYAAGVGYETQAVGLLSAVVNLTSSPNPSSVLSNVTFTASITPTNATGWVIFRDGSTPLCTNTLAAGAASFSVTNLAQGSHSLTAAYSGDSSYATNTSATLTQVVNGWTVGIIGLTISPNPSKQWSNVTFTATLSSSVTNGPAISGAVTFLDGGAPFSTNTLATNAASFSTTNLLGGSHRIQVNYPGDSIYGASVSGVQTQVVNQASSFIFVPFGGTNHHTGLEPWPPFYAESWSASEPGTAVDWASWQGWRAFDTNFHLADARLSALEAAGGGGGSTGQTNWPLSSITNRGTLDHWSQLETNAFDAAGTAAAATTNSNLYGEMAIDKPVAFMAPHADYDACLTIWAIPDSAFIQVWKNQDDGLVGDLDSSGNLSIAGSISAGSGLYGNGMGLTNLQGAAVVSAVSQARHATNADSAITASGGWPTSWPYTAITSPPWLTGNQTVTVSGDATGSGATAITVVVTNIVPPGGGSTGQPLVKTATGVGFGSVAASAVTGLTDADTNSILMSPVALTWTTNSLVSAYGTTNLFPWLVTNFATLTFQTYTGRVAVLWSTDGGTSWNASAQGDAIPPALGAMTLALADYDHVYRGTNTATYGGSYPAGITNVVITTMTRPDLFGRTNQVFGQTIWVQDPVSPNDVANKEYCDRLFTSQAWWSAANEVQLNGYGLHLDSAWNLLSVAGSNTLSATWLGNKSWSVSFPTPIAVPQTNFLSAVNSSTNLVVKISTNGLAQSPTLMVTHYLSPLNWSFVSTTAVLTNGTNWQYTFPKQWPDSTFLSAVTPSASPGAFSLNTVLDLYPFATAIGTNSGALRLWNSNNAALYARGTNGVDKLLLSFP